MTELWTLISFSLLWAIVLYPLISRCLVSPRRTTLVAIAIGTALTMLLRSFIVNMMVVALFEPLPLTLVTYALAFLARPFGFQSRPWPKSDIAISIVAGFVLMFSATGVLPFDIYRYGYEPLPVSAIAVVLALLALWRRHVLLCLSVPLALLLWMFNVASSNFFDHIFHVLWFLPLLYMLAAKHEKVERCLPSP